MRVCILPLILLFACAALCGASYVSETEALARRVIGASATRFKFSEDARGAEYFSVQSDGTTVAIIGSNAVDMAMGLNHYLKYACNISLSWETMHTLPLSLPLPLPGFSSGKVAVSAQWRYYFNTCTFGYSMTFWNWSRWEKEIDWMAMQGINLPLVATGQERVWVDTFVELGLDEATIRTEFLSGPAFLPWQRMGNINGYLTPLPVEYIDDQTKLAQLILSRTRALGMKPVLAGFAGHVPKALKTVYPEADITQLVPWNMYEGTWLLDPHDELYARIQRVFIQKQTELYGTDHMYSIDPFNEELPPSNDPDYLRQLAITMESSLLAADPEAVWVLQGWFIYFEGYFWKEPQRKAFFGGLDPKHLLVLDLFADEVPMWSSTDSFDGHNFVWNMLNNFGGRSGLFGTFPHIHKGIAEAQTSKYFVGIGTTPEAIETNSVNYEYLYEFSWRNPIGFDAKSWMTGYTRRRYGKDVDQMIQAWDLLRQDILACEMRQEGASGLFVALRPQRNATKIGCCCSNNRYYDTTKVSKVWSLFMDPSVVKQLGSNSAYRYDLIVIATQAMNDRFYTLVNDIWSAYDRRDRARVTSVAAEMTRIMNDLERLLASDSRFMVGPWIDSARKLAGGVSADSVRTVDQKLADYYELNARMLISTWGPEYDSNGKYLDGASFLEEYSYRMWSGLVKDVYLPRWTVFFQNILECLDAQCFDQATFDKVAHRMVYAWGSSLAPKYPVTAVGDTVVIAQELYKKYM